MKKAVEAFQKELKKLTGRIERLSQSIVEDRESLKELEGQYKAAVIQDDSKQSTALFKQIEEVKSNLRMNEKQLSVLEATDNSDTLQPLADAVIDLATKEILLLQKKIESKFDEADKIKESLFDKMKEIGELQAEENPIQNIVNEFSSIVPSVLVSRSGAFDYHGIYNAKTRTNHRVAGIAATELEAKIYEGVRGE